MRYKSSKIDLKELLIILFFIFPFFCFSQDLDIEAITKKPSFRINGGINADGMFFNSSTQKNSFTYMLTGSLNFSFFTFSMPVSYSITNQGESLNYKVPFEFNRFSIAPKYKWVKLYLGDHALSFSPYSLNGHPFRGVAIELTPKGAIKFSAMGGRFLKAIQEDKNTGQKAIFERFGSAIKFNFDKEKYKIELNGLYAWDNRESLNFYTDVTPKSNYVGGLKISTTLIKNLNLETQYTLSVIQEDIIFILNQNIDHSKYFYKSNAFDTKLNYTLGKSLIGISYQNIDPNFQTFGATYFDNDLENITLNFSRVFFKDRVSISTQAGYQRDNLDYKKKQTSIRLVGNINVSAKLSEKLNISGSYSNFTSTTNRRLNQFDYINMPNMNPADTLNYRQLSQNGNINANYIFGKDKNQNLNFNYSIAGQANEQGGIIRKGQASTIQNYNLSHNISFSSLQMSVSTSANYTNNKVGREISDIWGGSISLTKKFFENKLSSNFTSLYNFTNDEIKNTILGFKLGCNYTLFEKHNFSFYSMQMFRKSSKENLSDLTINFNYSYNF